MVMQLKPQNAVTIIECDINIEFDAAEGYVEPTYKQRGDGKNKAGTDPANKGATSEVGSLALRFTPENLSILQEAGDAPVDVGWKPFAGSGFRLDGKKMRTPSVTSASQPQQKQVRVETGKQEPPPSAAIMVDEDYKPGELRFVRTNYKSRAVLEKLARDNEEGNDGLKPFSGKGQTIKGRHC
jgi:ubiquitin fusion degradation protein 1